MARRFLRGAVVAATTGIGATFLAPMAAHAAVACGQTITASMTLDHDMNCPTGNGVNINAHNVVLDLGGHTINGAPPSGGGRRGVSVTFDHHGVVITNGVIRGFDQGVGMSGQADATVTGLTLDSNGSGIITQADSAGSRITGNAIVNTTQFSAIQLGGSRHVVESNSIVSPNGTGVFLSGHDNLIRGNRITDPGAAGVGIGRFPSTFGPFRNNQVTGNSITGASRVFSSSSISVTDSSGARVEGNFVSGRRSTPGVFVENSANTIVSANSLTGNGSGVLVRGGSTGTQVTANQAAQNAFTGIFVENLPTSTLVADNRVLGNGGHGIDVRSPATTVARNTAQFNRGLGIFAVAGVVDDGGNKASGNGDPAQCSPNIVCT